MDLAAVIVFLIAYYLRPQEWASIFSTVHFVQLAMIGAVASLVFRERRVELKDLLRTPHDWAMLFFFGWIVLSSPTPWITFRAVYPLAIFYITIVQILYNVPRMKVFVGWWTFLLVGVACLALAGEHGFDPLGSYDITHSVMKDRLMLNLSIFNNPNGLGHSVAPAIAMLYFFCIWKRPLFMKQIGIAFIGLPLWCIYLTVSKGAFLCTAGTILATLTFGRPKAMQIFVISCALVLGSVAIYKLPRMGELNKSKVDPAIQGRVTAFKHGLKMIITMPRGIGYGNWMESFYRAHRYYKAAHSSYVQTGAELGYPGFYFFFAILYCNLRTLLTLKTNTDDEERIRRTLFVLVLSYMVSSWMVDFGFRPTLFMFSAAVAALHRHVYGLAAEPVITPEEAEAALPPWRRRLLPAMGPQLEPALAMGPPAVPRPIPYWRTGGGATPPDDSGDEPPRAFWNKLNWLDLLIILGMTISGVYFWAYMISRM